MKADDLTLSPLPQIRDLNRGAFGFVVLAHDKQCNDRVALKFIERGPEVRQYFGRCGCGICGRCDALPRLYSLQACALLQHGAARQGWPGRAAAWISSLNAAA